MLVKFTNYFSLCINNINLSPLVPSAVYIVVIFDIQFYNVLGKLVSWTMLDNIQKTIRKC